MPIFAGPPEPVVEASPAPAQENPCSFRASLYGWMQSLDGTVGVRGIESDVNIPFKDIVDDLNFGAMGVPELRYKRWAITADMVHADLRGSADTPFQIFFSKVDYEQKQFLCNFVPSYLLVDSPRFKLDLYAGARVNCLDAEVTLIGKRLPLPPSFPPFIVPNRDFGGSKTWVDPIVGGKFQANGVGYRAPGTDYSSGGFKYDVTASGPVIGSEIRF